MPELDPALDFRRSPARLIVGRCWDDNAPLGPPDDEGLRACPECEKRMRLDDIEAPVGIKPGRSEVVVRHPAVKWRGVVHDWGDIVVILEDGTMTSTEPAEGGTRMPASAAEFETRWAVVA